jgi:hypothetical protein
MGADAPVGLFGLFLSRHSNAHILVSARIEKNQLKKKEFEAN